MARKFIAAYVSVLGFLFFSLLSISFLANAGVVLGGTRLVYDADKKEVGLSLKNTEKNQVFLVQSWIENYAKNNKREIPFVILPPLFRLDQVKEGVIRVKGMPNNLPKDRESIFWLNVKSISASDKEQSGKRNSLQISIISKIKLFYRPVGLAIRPDEVAQKISVKNEHGHLKVVNPTPYYVNFHTLKVNDRSLENVTVLAPFSEDIYPVDGPIRTVKWQVINDYGGITLDIVKTL